MTRRLATSLDPMPSVRELRAMAKRKGVELTKRERETVQKMLDSAERLHERGNERRKALGMPRLRARIAAKATKPREATEPPQPITLAIPWGYLCRDNARHGLMRGRIVLTARYRDALLFSQILVGAAMKGRQPITGRVALVATFHEPDRKRKRDVTNYAKLLCDALSPAAILDDSQIDDARYVRGDVDKTDPRVVVTLAIVEAAR
jgi:Holliday junction resolvase RusA-like endonuclease